ncbi:hypothetical protein J2S00_001979 [Caldalkalibacillus uzonensis]|uniref:Uncharacterized protein n=1 Tax=Caldalkalibacillus uzonensis TaxID=353224 RepID=A0ABU0CRY5_9BACI|nr:hypothetical protein [Caldalkalibacillus uzonensis]MDQ0339193.1 hypothetical protein [Caldalkalibacillus uzonensis]
MKKGLISTQKYSKKSHLPQAGGKKMGEEKPEEELMGKRKSSPRLSSALNNADIIIMDSQTKIIPKKTLIVLT